MVRRILMAGDPSCPACQSAKRFLDEKKVRYNFYDVNEGKGRQLADRAKADAIPVIKVCNVRRANRKHKSSSRCKTFIGFDQVRLSGALGL